MKIKHADNTWRTDPVDQYRTLITGNRQVRPLQVRQLAQAQGDGQTHAQRVHEAIHEGLHAQRLLGRKGVQDSTWIAFPSFTPACFVEDRETNHLLDGEEMAVGAHETLLEETKGAHNWEIYELEMHQWCPLLGLFIERARDLAQDTRLHQATLQILPTSMRRLPLTHAQLLALPAFEDTASLHGACPVCADLILAQEAGTLVKTTAHFAAYVPFAPRNSVHLRVIHKTHQSVLSGAKNSEQLEEFSSLLWQCTQLLHGFHPGAQLQGSLGPLYLQANQVIQSGHTRADLHWVADADQGLGQPFPFRTSNYDPAALAQRLRDG